MDAHASIAEVRLLVARSLVATPPAADPCGDAPHPPACNLGVEVIRVGLHALAELFLLREPQVPRLHVGFIDRPIRGQRYGFGIVLQRPPEVGQHAIKVVDGLGVRLIRPAQQNSTRAEERLDVVLDLAKALPNEMGRAALTAEIREGGFYHALRANANAVTT
jgi:hypothetical protein